MGSDKEKKTFIIDTCAFRPAYGENNLARILGGVDSVTPNNYRLLRRYINLFEEVDEFVKLNDSILLPEVLRENEGFLKHLENQRRIISRQIRHTDFLESPEALEDFPFIFSEDLDKYVDRFFYFNDSFKRKPKNPADFNPLQQRVYRCAFERALLIHRDNFQNGQATTLGDQLQTDRKIIATALALAIKNPVTVISRDTGLIGNICNYRSGSLKRVIDSFNFERRQHDSLNVNPQKISVYNPRDSDNGFYDSEKERVVYERRR
ncbi:MAG: hypothetical protein Q7R87_02405 [Nanoarchaeota archaeon]|nr:hypothetical protein [Nanoarchaeota archaeon]